MKIVGFTALASRDADGDHQFFCLTDDGEIFVRTGSDWYAVFAGGTLADRMESQETVHTRIKAIILEAQYDGMLKITVDELVEKLAQTIQGGT